MSDNAREATFQRDILAQMQKDGWLLGKSSRYDRERALYTEDCLAYVRETQGGEWEKFSKNHPKDPEAAFLDLLTARLAKVDPHAADRELRKFGTLGVLRHALRDRDATFRLCQFRPEHDLNPDVLARYKGNILRVVPEVVYSPHTTVAQLAETGAQAKRWRIDLVLFLNGIPIVTMELKSDFQQAIDAAKHQYRTTRLPKDPKTRRPEPLLTFKRGALVHFALSQSEAWMTTKLAGKDTVFLPFNQGTKDGGAGNDVPENLDTYATAYVWQKILSRKTLLDILGRFIHLEIDTEEAWDGRKTKKEKLIFPRYHQWNLVTRLIKKTQEEGPGHKYLVQHSAGSGKSNSIAWTALQLTALHTEDGDRLFDSVIVVTDRTVLDDQLQRTISQYDVKGELVVRINRKEGQGSKSSKLAEALETREQIIIVTIQTFPHVLDVIENREVLKTRRYAIIADEAHSSQSGKTARELKEVLTTAPILVDEDGVDESGGEVSAEDRLNEAVEARRASPNLSYYAFTATPKAKTLQLFGRPPRPDEPISRHNKPEPFDIYSMRQAIEEGYILDVLRNYTSYKVAYRLAQEVSAADPEVDKKKAAVKLGQWVRLHDYNIAQKVKEIVEHYRGTVMGLLGGRAKAMVVTSSRKEAVRYKLEFDRYVAKRAHSRLAALVAFSGEVTFDESDPNAEGLLDRSFNETSMNPGLKGRTLRDAFDTDEFQVMIVANKFQTGFDQPKLCAMYVDKKLGGVDCVQTLSRLNRRHQAKEETYVLDFVNEPDDVLAAFQEYYQTARLLDVSDPNLIWDLYEKLRDADIFRWSEVERFAEVYYVRSKSGAAVANLCKPAVERWQSRYQQARDDHGQRKGLHERAKATADPVLVANTENDMKDAKRELDALTLFKKDLGSFVRYYEFMSQIVDYDSTDLERLSLYARHLHPLLREVNVGEDPIDLSSVALSHYRLSKIKQQDLKLQQDSEAGLQPASELGSGKPRSKEEAWLSEIIERLNELFVTDDLSNADMMNYTLTVRDKVGENERVMGQIANNSPERALIGDFPDVVDEAVMSSSEAHQNQMMQYLNNKELREGFRRLILDLLIAREASPLDTMAERLMPGTTGISRFQATSKPPMPRPDLSRQLARSTDPRDQLGAALLDHFEKARRITLADAILAANQQGLEDTDALAAVERLARPQTAGLRRFYVERSTTEPRLVDEDEVRRKFAADPAERRAWGTKVEVVWAANEVNALGSRVTER